MMPEEEEIRRRLEAKSDEALLDIVEGRDLGYRDVAVRVASDTLQRRGIPFEAVPLAQLQLAATQREEELDTLDRIRQDRKAGRTLLVLGIGWFILPAFGLQFQIFGLFGSASIVVAVGMIASGVALLRRAERVERDVSKPQGPDEPRAAESRGEEDTSGWPVTVGKVLLVIALFYALIALLSLIMGDAWR